MKMPERLREAIHNQAASFDRAAIVRASAEITAAYKANLFALPPLRTPAHRLAYALARMPATYAANYHVLEQLRQAVPTLVPRSVLDVGSGPGTSAWAAVEHFPSVESFTLLERDLELSRLGQKLANDSEVESLKRAKWLQQDLAHSTELPPSDLVVISYALGELSQDLAARLLTSAVRAAQQALVIVEPGTRRGFEVVLAARERLIAACARIAAPCPHGQQCPMAAAGDWCHFAQRIERTAEHRKLKEGSLGYEDEKFSYIAACKLPVTASRARIVRHPQIFSGYVKLQLCSGPVLEQQTVTRSKKDLYKEARHADWGDQWNH